MVVEIDSSMQEQVKMMFITLDAEVSIHLFTKDHDCLYCADTQTMVTQIANLSDKVIVIQHKGDIESGKAEEMGVKFTPAIVLHGKGEYKVRFYGIPVGLEFGSLVGGIVAVSTGKTQYAEDLAEDIMSIDKPVHIQVFTTPQCPFCPDMVRLAHFAAILNPLIEADMVEALEFQEHANKYKVFGVPKTIINEDTHIDGKVTPEMFVEKLLDATE